MTKTAITSLLLALFVTGCPSNGIPSYDPCTRSNECAGGDDCVEIEFSGVVRNMCTRQRCVVDADCAFDARGQRGICIEFPGALSTCFEGCGARADCADGWSCERLAPTAGTEVRACVPVPTR